jgi:cytidylate kinase
MGKENIIIVIGRQFGGGGRALGRIISDKLAIPFYDKELIDEAATHYGFDASLMAHADEKRPSMLRSIVECVYGNVSPSYDFSSLSVDRLYEMQSRVIERIAEDGNAVFVGRTADYVLRANPSVVSVFIHADVEARAKRIVERGDCATIEEAVELAQKKDKLRSEYYNYFTGKKWGSADNYDLSIDMSVITLQEAADLVVAFAKAKLGKTKL